MGDVSGMYEASIVREADCIIGPFRSPRGVITLAMMIRTVLANPTMEMRETRKLEFMEDDESVRRRVGQRDECMVRVITLHESAELTLCRV